MRPDRHTPPKPWERSMNTKGKQVALVLVVLAGVMLGGFFLLRDRGPTTSASPSTGRPLDNSGFSYTTSRLEPWKDPTSLDDIAAAFVRLGHRHIGQLDKELA